MQQVRSSGQHNVRHICLKTQVLLDKTASHTSTAMSSWNEEAGGVTGYMSIDFLFFLSPPESRDGFVIVK